MQTTAIKEYIKSRGEASLTELCQRFSVSSAHIRHYLHKLEEKGIVQSLNPALKCKTGVCGCRTCIAEHLEIYIWKN